MRSEISLPDRVWFKTPAVDKRCKDNKKGEM